MDEIPRFEMLWYVATVGASIIFAIALVGDAPSLIVLAASIACIVAGRATITLAAESNEIGLTNVLMLSTIGVLPIIIVGGPAVAVPAAVLGSAVSALVFPRSTWSIAAAYASAELVPVVGASLVVYVVPTERVSIAGITVLACISWLICDVTSRVVTAMFMDQERPLVEKIRAVVTDTPTLVQWSIEFPLVATIVALWGLAPGLVALVLTPLTIGVILTSRKVAADEQNRFLTETFQRYVPARMVEALIESGADLDLGGTEVEISVLFCDIRGFTGWSESLPARQVVDELNVLLGDLVAQVTTTGGTLDKFTGDGLMAFWGAPLAQADHAERATICATRMARAMDERNAMRAQRGLPPLMVGIGIHSGSAIVGAIGTKERHDFTAIGDTVNVAARLESMTKELAAIAIISYQTYLRLPPAMQHQCPAPLAIPLKGRAQPVPAHVLIPMPQHLRATHLPPAA